MGSDTQRSAWILFLVVLGKLGHEVWEDYNLSSHYLSACLYLGGLILGFVGCAIFVASSYPDSIVRSCYYSNESICPEPGSWCFVIHFGTRILRGAHLQLWGALLYFIGSVVWIQEDFASADPASSTEYVSMITGSFLLVYGSYWQLLAQYPDQLSAGKQNTCTSSQMHGWCWEILAILWLIRSVLAFDSSTSVPSREEEPPVSVPFSEYDWCSFWSAIVAIFFATGSYFILAQAYKEGTRMDAILVQKAREAAVETLRETDELVVGVPGGAKKSIPHPLSGIPDPTSDFRMVLKRARQFMHDEGVWKMDVPGGPLKIFTHTTAHAIKFETSRFRNIDPLLLVALIQSDVFKEFQVRSRSSGSSVKTLGKLQGKLHTANHSASTALLFHEIFPPNPPMPAHEAVFASLLNETRRDTGEDLAELVEWPTETGGNRMGSSDQPSLLRVDPFRYICVSSEGVLTVCVWLEEIARWMPDFLLRAEMKKVPLLVQEIEAFLGGAEEGVKLVEKSLGNWIWQKIHNSVSPLAAAVLVRSSPAYRVLLSKFPGLRTRVPEAVVPTPHTSLHPLSEFPKEIISDFDVTIPALAKLASDFSSSESGQWHSEEYKQKPGRPRLCVWRRELAGETVKPFRIQVRVHGIDPMTLACIIHRNKLVDIVGSVSSNDDSISLSSRRQSVPPSPMSSTMSNNLSPTKSMAMTDMEFGQVVVHSRSLASFQDGAVRVFSERKRHAKLMLGARDREFTFASIMRDVSPLKAVVVHFGVDNVYTDSQPIENDEDTISLRKFQTWTLENDGGSDTKLTWAGLIPVGGRTQKLSAMLSSGQELKEKIKFAEHLANIFTTDHRAREAIAETHAYIAYSTIRCAIHHELKKMSLKYLSVYSNDYKALISEIQPIVAFAKTSEKFQQSSFMGYEQDIRTDTQNRKRHSLLKAAKRSTVVMSDVTPENPHYDPSESSSVGSITSLDDDDSDKSIRTVRNDNDDDREDVIPNERDVR